MSDNYFYEICEEIIFEKQATEFPIKCLKFKQGNLDFFYYIFICEFNNEMELLKNFSSVNEIIAFDFQSELEKDIERWNIYLYFFVKEKVNKHTKFIIEQEKYATRKLIVDQSHFENLEDKAEYIGNKMFRLNFKNIETKFIEKTIDQIIMEKDKRLFEVVEDYTSKRLEKSRMFSVQNKKNILNYLGVEISE